MRNLLLVLPALAALVSAQNHRVSPVAARATEANGNNAMPWWSATHRYQQIHGDLRNVPMQVRELGLRRDGAVGTLASAVARTVDMDLRMAPSSHANASTTFAANHAAAPTQVVVRKMVNLPDFTANQGAPAPWNLLLPFDAPFTHAGTADLVWDLSVHSITSTLPYLLDAYSGFGVTSNEGTTADVGAGCTASGRTVPMTLSATTTAHRGPDRIEASWTSLQGAGSAATVILLGATNPDLPLPGVCTRLHSDGAVALAGTANPAGAFSTGTLTTTFQNAFANVTLYSQAWCADPGQAGLPFAGSQGVAVTVADLPARITRVWADDVLATTGTRSESYDFGLVVRFGY